MNNIAHFPIQKSHPLDDKKTLDLIWRLSAKDCNQTQFDQFIYIAKQKNLDPLLKQIYAIVIDKGTPSEAMIALTGIGGYRSIAARRDNYLPDEQAPKIFKKKSLISPINPLGIDRVEIKVRCYKFGEWHNISGTAKWSEYVPKETIYEYDNDGFMVETGQCISKKFPWWETRGESQLAKCAEADALRKGWPDDYANIYAPEEFERRLVDNLTPAEKVKEYNTQKRQDILGGPALFVNWTADSEVSRIPLGKFTDRVMEFLDQSKNDPNMIRAFENTNRATLREFWGLNKAESFAIRKRIEELLTGT